ncbi:alpha-amylase family glycosyl hydrolase [Streptomyces rhizosphaerihabitans]|uniref:alpha-amylase family glycosyl hydrolase n=1 Tax=Streptomyces rhizosphaerihabitans TaxID=1266770 RepID=UPI0021C04F18|nr:alpha-amylase family glycosyl hydrolase [Streptomyces rhizosphaerihabitans]MCT9006822.1 alpha-amylase family glycosyl hydrolase [Streptomyces rhizosphaerihabitans]
MSWPDHAIWWHVHPLSFLGAEPAALSAGAPVRHRLPVLADWLDHLVGLGCNGLALGPVFASETHGYDTTDYFRLDPRLGTEEDLRELVDRAASRGVRVLLDGVFNHVGRSFGPFADVARRGIASPYADWFVPEGDDFRTFEGHRHLVALNHGSPAVADHVVEVLDHWLDRGIAGWRLDAAYAVPRPFWRTVTDRVRSRHPGVWFSGEVIHGDYAAYVVEGGLDTVTQYELWKAVWSSLNDSNPHELAWALKRHNSMIDTFAPQTFVGNHDVTRVASRLGEPRHLAHALTVLFTVGGTPSIYAGDERAWEGVKEDRAGGDDAIRPAFPVSPSDLGPDGLAVQRLHQTLVGMRRRHPWLVRAQTRIHSLDNTVLSYTLAAPDAGATLAVALNFGPAPATAGIPAAPWAPVAGDASVDSVTGSVSLPPVGWFIATTSGSRN